MDESYLYWVTPATQWSAICRGSGQSGTGPTVIELCRRQAVESQTVRQFRPGDFPVAVALDRAALERRRPELALASGPFTWPHGLEREWIAGVHILLLEERNGVLSCRMKPEPMARPSGNGARGQGSVGHGCAGRSDISARCVC